MQNYCWQQCRLNTVTYFNSELTSQINGSFLDLLSLLVCGGGPSKDLCRQKTTKNVNVALETHDYGFRGTRRTKSYPRRYLELASPNTSRVIPRLKSDPANEFFG